MSSSSNTNRNDPPIINNDNKRKTKNSSNEVNRSGSSRRGVPIDPPDNIEALEYKAQVNSRSFKGTNNVEHHQPSTSNGAVRGVYEHQKSNSSNLLDYKAQVNSRSSNDVVREEVVRPAVGVPQQKLLPVFNSQKGGKNGRNLDYKAQVNDSRSSYIVAPTNNAKQTFSNQGDIAAGLDFKAQVNSRSVLKGIATVPSSSSSSKTLGRTKAPTQQKRMLYDLDDSITDLDYKAQVNGYRNDQDVVVVIGDGGSNKSRSIVDPPTAPTTTAATARIQKDTEKVGLYRVFPLEEESTIQLAGDEYDDNQVNSNNLKDDSKYSIIKKSWGAVPVDEESFLQTEESPSELGHHRRQQQGQEQLPVAEIEHNDPTIIPIVFVGSDGTQTRLQQHGQQQSVPPSTVVASDDLTLPLKEKSKNKRMMLILGLVTMVSIAAIVVGGVCGSGKCSRDSSSDNVSMQSDEVTDGNGSNATSPTVSPILNIPSPTAPPTVFVLDCSPTTIGPIPFTTPQQLYDAVDEYMMFLSLGDTSESTINNTDVTRCYGYPMNAWDVSQITDFSRVFDPNHNVPYDRLQAVRPLTTPLFLEDLNGWNTSSATNMFAMFAYNTNFNGNISLWDVSSVTNTSDMFLGATTFTGDLSAWDISSVTDMSFMFVEATLFNSDLSKWNTSSVEWMIATFGNAISFTSDLSQWDTTNVLHMGTMFAFASEFDSDLSSWDVSKVGSTLPTGMASMFQSALKFNGNISTWNVSGIEDLSGMFFGALSFNGDLSNWDVGNVRTMKDMFNSAVSFTSDLSQWNVEKVTTMENMFFEARSFNNNLSQWNTSNVQDISRMFVNATSFNGDISTWDVGNVILMNLVFADAVLFNSDISLWDVSNVQNMSGMFWGTSSFNGDLSRWNVSSVQAMSAMFASCDQFTSDLSQWDVGNVNDMSIMFAFASSFQSDLSLWDVSNVAFMDAMFGGATIFNSNISQWDVSNVQSMSGMFLSASSFNQSLCDWGLLVPYSIDVTDMFISSGCTITADPSVGFLSELASNTTWCQPCA